MTLRCLQSGRSSARSPFPPAVIALLLFGFFLSGAEAQDRAATVRNETERLFVYYRMTEEEWEARYSVPWIGDPVGFFHRAPESSDFVPPGGRRTLDITSPTQLAGYLVIPESGNWPLVTLTIAPGEQVRLTTEGISSRSVPVSQLPPPEQRILLDRRFGDWEKVPPLSPDALAAGPNSFYQETGGERSVLPIEASQSWGTPGSKLKEFKIVSSGETRFFLLLYEAPPAHDSFLLLYLYGESREKPLATLRIDPSANSGAVELRRPGEEPRRVGNYVREAGAVEGGVRLGEELVDAGELRFGVVATVISKAGSYEEFPRAVVEAAALVE